MTTADELTTNEAAQLAGVTRQAIAKAAADGKLKARKLNPAGETSPLLIERRSLLDWIKKKKRGQAKA